MVVASTLLSSCILLEPSPLYSSSELCYDDYDEASQNTEYIYLEDLFCYDDLGCSVCSCEHYQRACRQMNSACLCGHTRDSHSSLKDNSSLPAQPRFEVSVSYGNLTASYKEGVDVDPYDGEQDTFWENEVFINPLYIPAEGGSCEFEYVNETFYISSVYDSSMPLVNAPFTTHLFKSVKSLSYIGPYYSISCNMGKHTWKIEVDPMPISDEPETRCIYVLICTSSHNFDFVFHFEQSNFE